jgi:hypothetical protein
MTVPRRIFQVTGYKFKFQTKYSLYTFAKNKIDAVRIFNLIFNAKINVNARERNSVASKMLSVVVE